MNSKKWQRQNCWLEFNLVGKNKGNYILMIRLDNLTNWITHPKIVWCNIQIPSQTIKLWPSFKTQHSRNLHERTSQFLLEHIEEWEAKWDNVYHDLSYRDVGCKSPLLEDSKMPVEKANIWKLFVPTCES
jgi:hypothetical protein